MPTKIYSANVSSSSGSSVSTPYGATIGGVGQTTITTGDLLYGSSTDNLSKLGIGSYGQGLFTGQSSIPFWSYPSNISRWYTLQDDFEGVQTAGNWLQSSTAGGTVAGVAQADNTHLGVRRISTGTSGSTNSAAMVTTVAFNRFGGATYVWECIAKISSASLSSVSDRYIVVMGPNDIGGAGTVNIANGCAFRYTDNSSSGNWEFVTADNSTRTTTNTNTAADLNYHRFTIIVDSTGANAYAYIDGVLVATNTTNITTTRNLSYTAFGILKTIGTGIAGTFDVDSWACSWQFATPK